MSSRCGCHESRALNCVRMGKLRVALIFWHERIDLQNDVVDDGRRLRWLVSRQALRQRGYWYDNSIPASLSTTTCYLRLQQVIDLKYSYGRDISSYLYSKYYERSELQENSQRVVTFSFSHLFTLTMHRKSSRKFRNGPFKRQSMTQRSRMAAQHEHLKILPPPMMDAAYPSRSYAPAQVTLRPACPTLHVIDSTFVRMLHGATPQ
jgi:hypothetical protein